ncbi:MAG TPA: hypothetical protein DDW17_03460 [Deltaproteobacteria bacterium]|nr:hypothetical protein [Deltaproteobacteria bacterium]
MNSEFLKLIEKRGKLVESLKENNFDFNSILAGLYTDPSHFIYELLQNAEDEGAKEIRFELLKDRLDVYHNGKDFDLQDIDGVTGIGISKKKGDLNLIGKFGVGFKSVFAVTRSPYIFSGEYKIKIEEFIIPTPSDVSSTTQKNETLIKIPFNHKYRSREEIFTLIHKRLENLRLRTLLFLKNIEEIRWQIPSSNGHYLKSDENVQGIASTRKATLVSSNVTEEYLVIRKPIIIECKELWVEVAYKLGKDQNNKEIIVPEPNSELVVFFPTEKVTYLNFLIQGSFKTTPNRENIPLEDEQNRIILEEIGNLIAESLTIVKDLGYLDVNFLSILPLSSDLAEREQIYSVIYKKVEEKFLSEKLLPTSDGTYTKAGDSLLARGKELTEFLNKNDIQIFFSKEHWLDTNITQDKTPELRNYLMKELGIPEVDFESFARKITDEFLQTKSDEWMIDFYRQLLDQQSLWSERGSKGVLRAKPIIRLENNEHIAPFDNNEKIQVYLPAETKSEYKTVKRVLTENEESLKFLKELGLTKPDLFAEIKEFILPKYQGENPVKDERYFDDFEKLLRGYETIPSNKKVEFIKELSDAPFIYAFKNDNTEEIRLLKASQIYFDGDNLKNYFNGYRSVYFLSEKLYKKFEEGRVKEFLKDLGVEDKPRRIEIEGNLSWEEKSKLRGNRCYTRENQKDYEYDGLENFINDITPEKSYLLWKLLLKSIENLNSWQAQEFFEGEYGWLYRSQHNVKFDAKFVKTLRQQAWLVDKNNNFKKPSEITFSELSDDYIKESPNIDILIKALEFKPGIIELLPEDDRKKLEIVKDLTVEELEKILSERKKKPSEEEKKQWTPERDPDTVPIRIQEVKPGKIDTADLSGQAENIEEIRNKKLMEETGKLEKEVERTPIDKKAIGKWGEKYAYNVLKEKYQRQGNIIGTDSGFKVIDADGEGFEIIWLNKDQDKGIGYDFVIRRNGTETDYIEVKTKIEESGELIEVTGTQWEFARKLFEQNEGEKYSFYVVSNAGKENVEIHILRNPIKLWKEGKLYAHPVNFRL